MWTNPSACALIIKILDVRGYIELPSEGKSMYPYIKPGEICRFAKCSPACLSRGDVVLYRTPDHRLVAHRFYKSVIEEGKRLYLLKGDTNLGFDEPVELEHILGKLIWIRKKRTMIGMERWTSILWGKLVFVPYFTGLLRQYMKRMVG